MVPACLCIILNLLDSRQKLIAVVGRAMTDLFFFVYKYFHSIFCQCVTFVNEKLCLSTENCSIAIKPRARPWHSAASNQPHHGERRPKRTTEASILSVCGRKCIHVVDCSGYFRRNGLQGECTVAPRRSNATHHRDTTAVSDCISKINTGGS